MSWFRHILWRVWEGVGTVGRWLGQGLAPPEATRPIAPPEAPPEAPRPVVEDPIQVIDEMGRPKVVANAPPDGLTMRDFLTQIYNYFTSPEGVALTNNPVSRDLGETLLRPGGGEFPDLNKLISFLHNRGMYLLMTYSLANEDGDTMTRGFSLTNRWLTSVTPMGDLDIENNIRNSDTSEGEWTVDYSRPFKLHLTVYNKIKPRRVGGVYTKCKLNDDFPKGMSPLLRDWESLAVVLQVNTPENTVEPEIPCFIWAVSQYLTRAHPELFPAFEKMKDIVAAFSLEFHRDGFIQQVHVKTVAIKLGWCIITRCKGHTLKAHATNCTCSRAKDPFAARIGLVDNHYFAILPLKCKSKWIGIHPNRKILNTYTLMKLLPKSDWAEPFNNEELLIKLNKPIGMREKLFTEEMCRNMDTLCTNEEDHFFLKDDEEFNETVRSSSIGIERCEREANIKLIDKFKLYSKQKSIKDKLKVMKTINLPAYEIVLDIETCSIGDQSIVWPYSTSICYYTPSGMETECFFSNIIKTSLSMALDRILSLNSIRVGKILYEHGINLHYHRTQNGTRLMNALLERNPVTVWCHVLSFDFAPILREENMIRVYNMLGNLGSMKSCKLVWDCLGCRLPIKFKNSFSLIPAPLAKFGAMFDLEQHKAPFPYDFFTESRCIEYTQSGWYNIYTSLDDFMESIPVKARPALKEALIESESLKGDKVDIRQYVTYYNNLDVIVTMEGIMKFRSIYSTNFGCDVSGSCTIGGCSMRLAKNMGCFITTQTLSGEMSELIRTNIRGGYVFTRDNRPNFVVNGNILDTDEVLKGTLKRAINIVLNTNRGELQVFDLDVNSLYPYSQRELPSGNVRYIPLEDIEHYLDKTWLLCTYEITKLNSDYDIQFLPINRDDRRIFPKSLLEGEIIYLMGFKHTRDIMHAMGMKLGEHYKITSAVLWEYTNYSLGYLTDRLYRDRQIAVKKHNSGLANVLKLNLNNTWGKCGERTYNTDTCLYNTINDGPDHNRKSVIDIPRIMEYTKRGGVTAVTRYKKLLPDYESKSHVAMAVTERAKEVMFNYFRAFVDAGLYVLAHDTDSVHCCGKPEQVSEGMRIYTNRYGLDPEKLNENGHNPLGGMKSDFDGGCMFSGKVESQIARDHINVAPKLYCIVVEVTGKDKGDEESTMRYYGHVKAKGISKVALDNFINSCEGKDRREKILVAYTTLAWNVYHKRLNESVEEVVFNMLAGGISIAYSATGSVYRQKFERKM